MHSLSVLFVVMKSVTQPIRSVREQIADQLRNEILSDQLPANEPLREAQLAERFGTSRGPIRDVLLQLTQEGALVYKPNAGVRVGTPTVNGDRVLLISLRRQIELRALETIWKKLNDEDYRNLGDILEAMQRACKKRDMTAIAGSDMDLHRYVVRRAGSVDLEAIWLSIAVRIRMKYSRLKNYADIHREHVLIVDAIIAGDKQTARKALEGNIV